MKRHFLALEDADTIELVSTPEDSLLSGDELLPAAAQAQSQELELQAEGQDLQATGDQLVEGQAVVATLEQLTLPLARAAATVGFTRHEARALAVAVEGLKARLGAPRGRTLPALEAFGGTHTRQQGAQLALEGLGSFLKEAWKKFVQALTNFLTLIKNFFTKRSAQTRQAVEKNEALLQELQSKKGQKIASIEISERAAVFLGPAQGQQQSVSALTQALSQYLGQRSMQHVAIHMKPAAEDVTELLQQDFAQVDASPEAVKTTVRSALRRLVGKEGLTQGYATATPGYVLRLGDNGVRAEQPNAMARVVLEPTTTDELAAWLEAVIGMGESLEKAQTQVIKFASALEADVKNLGKGEQFVNDEAKKDGLTSSPERQRGFQAVSHAVLNFTNVLQRLAAALSEYELGYSSACNAAINKCLAGT